jgi:prevent-host-death family protein
MFAISMHEAESQLSKLVQAVEDGEIEDVIITRDGRPAARLTAISAKARTQRRIGLAKGLFVAPANPEAGDVAVATLFPRSDA